MRNLTGNRPVAAALLGLPAALLAHSLVFGSGHAAGGALAFFVLGGAVLTFVVTALLHAKNALEGSVAAARVRECAPNLLQLVVAVFIWYQLIELCEVPHAASPLAVVAAIAIACIVIVFAVRGLARVLARVAIALAHVLSLDALPTLCSAPLRLTAPQPLRALAHAGRLYSRPPPALS